MNPPYDCRETAASKKYYVAFRSQAGCLAPGAYGKIFWKQPFRGNRRDCFAIRDSIKFSRPFPFAINHENFSSQLFIRYPSSILRIELGRISSYRYGGLKVSFVGWSSGDVGGDGSPVPNFKAFLVSSKCSFQWP